MKLRIKAFGFAVTVAVAMMMLAPGKVAAQSGTVTDDAFASSNATTQQANLKGQGFVLVVAGSSATVGIAPVGTTKAYIKFQLQSSLPPSVAAANVAKATLKLFLSTGTSPSGAVDIYPIMGAWSESTVGYASQPVLAGAPFATGINVGSMNSFLVVDVTALVQEWLNGAANGGLDNFGIALVAHGNSTYAVFDSKEGIVTSHEPRLEIVLVNGGPQGSAGPQGPAGASGPAGPAGPAGAAATVQVTSTTTAPPGSPASVLNGGTPSAAQLNFIIPQGATGPAGVQGAQGPAGPAGPMGLTGPQGVAGPVGPAGPAGINNRGAWNAANDYSPNDAVSDQGSFWLALQAVAANTPNSEPSSTNASWQLLAAQGTAGAAGAAGLQGPKGDPGPMGLPGLQGPQGPPGPSGSGGSGTGGFNGIQQFTQSGTFTVPTGVTHLLVEIWGGGGGAGGSGFSFNYTYPCACDITGCGSCGASCLGGFGGGGGSGGYTRAVITVVPGATYNVIVGNGGQHGQNGSNSTDGSAASDSKIVDLSGNLLVNGGGGQGGTAGSNAAATNTCTPGVSGRPGAGGSAGTGAQMIGLAGILGGSPGSSTRVLPPSGSISLPSSTGIGGASSIQLAPGSGGDGYILITW
jgi:hypothetical protein